MYGGVVRGLEIAPGGEEYEGESKTPTAAVQRQCPPVSWVNRLLTLTDVVCARNRSIKAGRALIHTRNPTARRYCASFKHDNCIVRRTIVDILETTRSRANFVTFVRNQTNSERICEEKRYEGKRKNRSGK